LKRLAMTLQDEIPVLRPATPMRFFEKIKKVDPENCLVPVKLRRINVLEVLSTRSMPVVQDSLRENVEIGVQDRWCLMFHDSIPLRTQGNRNVTSISYVHILNRYFSFVADLDLRNITFVVIA
jgi:hypothetical protein